MRLALAALLGLFAVVPAAAQPAAGTSPSRAATPARAAPPARPAAGQPATPTRPAAARPAARPSRPEAAPPAAAARSNLAPPSEARATRRRARAAAAVAAASAAAAAVARPPEPTPAPTPPAPTTGGITGLPLPRFAALGANEVNLRVGPDTRFPIDWTYQRRDLPVQIVAEHSLWRRIRDAEGTEGWVHQATLAGRRTFIITGEERVLRRAAEDGAAAVARLRPGVVGRLRRCEENSPWCEAQVGEHRGWLRRTEFWGVGPDEAVN